MASGAAVKVAGLFSQANLVREPLIAVVNRTAPPLFSTCVGCFMCQTACPYQAIEREEIKDRNGNVIKTVAKVIPDFVRVVVLVLLSAVPNLLIYKDILMNRSMPK